MSDCIFCKIVAGEIPCHEIYEDDQFLGFLDIHPKTVGHCLLIPKQHYRWTYDVPNFGTYFDTAKKIILKLLSTTKADFVSIVTYGMDVHHAHIQLIPEYSGKPNLSDLSLDQIAVKINS